MSASLLPGVTRLARAGPVQRAAQARALLSADPAWEAWRDALNALHHTDPVSEARAAAALAGAARVLHRRDLAARFLLLEARGTLRGGSPARAADLFARAERELRAAKMPERAAAAAAARVDALALSGRLGEALSAATQAARRLRGPALASGRAFLAINRANALRLVGDLDAARRDYARAAAVLERLDDRGNAAIARLNEGVALLESGEAERAHALFAASERAFLALSRGDMALEARYNAACADVRRGRLGAAVVALEALAREHAGAGLVRRAALCRMDLADALARAGDASGAEREALAAAEGFRTERATAEEAEALGLAARAASASSPKRARAHLRRARARAAQSGRPGLGLRLDLLHADLETAAGRAVPDRVLVRLGAQARRLGQHEVEAQVALLRARAAFEGGRPAAARTLLAAPRLAHPSHPWLAVAADTLRGLLDASAGRVDAALERLASAAAFVERVDAALPGAWLRTGFLLEHLDPWLARVDLLLQRGTPADRRAAARLLDEVAQRRFRGQGRAPKADARLRALRARLEGLYDRLARGEGGVQRGVVAGSEALLLRARRIERALASRWQLEERRRAPGAARRPVALRPRALAPGEAVLRLWARGGRLLALREDAGDVGPRHDLGSLASLSALLDRVAFQARRAALPGGESAPLRADLARLADLLLLPLRDGAWPARLTLLLDPALPDIPFEALPVAGTLLASALELVRAPVLGGWALHGPRRDSAAPSRTALLALGEPDLPGVAQEVAALAPSADVHAGPAATRAALSHALQAYDVVHVAGHGFDAPEAPALGGVRLFDGWYGAADLPPRIGARLVVLAACRTGRASGREAQAWGGLPARLLASGARYVLWTADDVDDAASAALSLALHTRLAAGSAPAAAFGQALADVADRLASAGGNLSALLPFRLSGFPS